MKKITALFLTCMLLVSALTACSAPTETVTTAEPPSTATEQVTGGKVTVWGLQSILIQFEGEKETLQTLSYDDKGNVSCVVVTDAETGAEKSRSLYEYDALGRETKNTLYENGAEIFRAESVYDAAGNMTDYASYEDGVLKSRTKREYNTFGKIVNMKEYEGETLEEETRYTYDARNRVTKMETYQDGALSTVYLFELNDADLLTKQVVRMGDEELTWIFIYDEKGNCTEESYTNGESVSTLVYTYDDKGNVLTEVLSENGVVSYTKTQTYDEAGRFTHSLTLYANGSKETKTQTYDENGNCLTEYWTDEVSEVIFYNAYDEHGNRISRYGVADGKEELRTTMTYVEMTLTVEEAERVKESNRLHSV